MLLLIVVIRKECIDLSVVTLYQESCSLLMYVLDMCVVRLSPHVGGSG